MMQKTYAKRVGALIVALALLLTLLPTSVFAENGNTIYTNMEFTATGDGSSAKPFKNFEDALNAAKDGDTIVIQGKAILNEASVSASGVPCVIDKAITIQPEGDSAALSVRTAGIVLAADVTIRNIELNFANRYHNAIFANGHRFTAINVTRGSGSREVHLFAGTIGAATGLSFTAAAGTGATFTLQNSEFGNIYAGSVAESSNVTMNVDISNSKAIGTVYGSGAQEKKVTDNWFDTNEPDPPVADTQYTSGDAIVTVDSSTALTVDGDGAKSMNVIVRDGKNYPMTLSNLTALTAQGGQVKVASINESAHVTLMNSAELDLSDAANGTDVKLATLTSSDGTGKLILGKGHLLTIASTIKGTFALETPGNSQGTSGEAEYDHAYITALHAEDATVNFTPHSTQSTMKLEKITGEGVTWTTWKTTAAPVAPTTVSEFETAESSVSADSASLKDGDGVTIPVTWESSAPDSPFKSLAAIPFHYEVTYNGVTKESVDTENEGMYESRVAFDDGKYMDIMAGDAFEQEKLPDRLDIYGDLSAGIYTITIYAPKADGSKIQLTLMLTVTDGTEAATATELTAPTADTQYTENDSITLTAKVTSNGQPVGEGEVIFWINGTALGAPGQIKTVTVSADGTASTTVTASAANHFKINEANTVRASYRGVPGDYDASESAAVSITVNEAATPTYILKFDVNGGAASPTIPNQEVEVGAKPVKPADPTRTGYTFLGWKNGSDIVDWDTFTMPEGNMTFTAAWAAETYTIRYDANGETTTPASIAPQQYVYDTADAKLTADVFASDTKNFLGWSLSSTAAAATYAPEAAIDDALKAEMVKAADNTVTLYAVWQDKPIADVTVSFDVKTNGGEFADGTTEDKTQTGKPGTALTLPSVKDRIGFDFTGWWTAATSGTKIIDPAVFPNANANYFAQWMKKADVEVIFDSGSGVWNDGTSGEKSVPTTPGSTAEIPSTVTRGGYYLSGWESNNNAYPNLFSNAERTGIIQEGQPVRYTAQWLAKTYTIRYDKNGLADAEGTVGDQQYVYDTPNAKLTDAAFTSTTKNFLGWSLNADDTAATYASGTAIDEELKTAMLQGKDNAVTLYAIWADKDAVSMTFNAGEGAFADGSKEQIESVRPGQQNTLPAAPTRDGYTFDGWASSNADYPDLAKDATQTPAAIDGKNANYTAKWVKNETTEYSVIFRSGSHGSFTNANDPLVSQSVESGKSVTGTPDITAERNYRFAGWQIGGAGTVYTRAQVIAMAITDDTVFIATYSSTGGSSSGSTGYIIKASAGSNGSISPSGSVSVAAGSNKTFTTTANTGYKISDVLVDGKSIGAVESYTFEKVRANHTIEVVFAKESGVEDPKTTGVADWLNTEEHAAFMTGYENGTFGAENAVTRAQVAQMFFNLLKDKNVRITVNFTDVASNAWHAKAVNTLGSLGIVSGVGDNRFDPNRAITRAEFTAIATRFAKANEAGSVRFSDVPVSAWYYNAVLTAVNYGWITGVGNNRFAPSEQITRAEAATIVNRMLARSADKAYVDTAVLRQFSDLSASHWAYYQIMEASNAHGHRMNADGSEIWTDLH